MQVMGLAGLRSCKPHVATASRHLTARVPHQEQRGRDHDRECAGGRQHPREALCLAV